MHRDWLVLEIQTHRQFHCVVCCFFFLLFYYFYVNIGVGWGGQLSGQLSGSENIQYPVLSKSLVMSKTTRYVVLKPIDFLALSGTYADTSMRLCLT